MNIAFIREVGPMRWAMRTLVRQFYKRIARRDHRMLLPTGAWMNLPIASHFASEAFITNADVDWGSEALLASLLENCGVFLDIGANIGYYSLYMLPQVQAVYSFEPDPRALPLLEWNVGSHPAIHVIPCAVGAADSRALFMLGSSAETSHFASGKSKLAEPSCEASARIEVDVVTVDSFVRSRNLTVEAIKIDAEGHDIEVLRGALGVLREQSPLVLTEARPDAVLFTLLSEVEYRVFAFVRHPRTRKKWFTEIVADRGCPGVTKMLFLVPVRLAENFTLRARNSTQPQPQPVTPR